jgi:hypothetical protein
VTAAAGSSLKLSSDGSSDPDGDPLTYAWAFYKEPSSYTGSVPIQNGSSDSPTVAIPADAGGKPIHIIPEIMRVRAAFAGWGLPVRIAFALRP